MIKYTEARVTFSEIPEEVTLCINISGCPVGCIECHSSYLAKDIGTPLTEEALSNLINKNEGITCVSFMGGDANPDYIIHLAHYVKENYPTLKTAWYSGRNIIPDGVETLNFIKLGPYDKELGPLTSPTTNQRFFELIQVSETVVEFNNITYKFWKHD